MKKVLKLVAILLGIGIVGGCMNTPSKERMNEKGKIKSYEINYDKTYYNSRRGIEIEIYINGDNNLKINSLITKDNGKYNVAVSVESNALAEFLEK